MKSIIILFSYLYMWAFSLPFIKEEQPQTVTTSTYEPVTIQDYAQQYLFEIGEEINMEIPEDFTDTDIMYAIERVCQRHHFTVAQTYFIYKLFYL